LKIQRRDTTPSIPDLASLHGHPEFEKLYPADVAG
jgi:hypothetical protein